MPISKLSLCAAALMMVGGHAFAADPVVTQGKVTFNGELTAETCTIVPGDEDKQVQLPKLSVLSLAKAGDMAGSTDFSLSVENCGDVANVAAHFEAINNTGYDAATSNLTNSVTKAAGGADKVQVRLFDAGTSKQIPVGGTGAFFPIDTTAKKATMHYVGGYYAIGKTTAGKVTAQVQYTLAYK